MLAGEGRSEEKRGEMGRGRARRRGAGEEGVDYD